MGTDSSTYTVASTIATDSASYSVVVTDDEGSVTSSTVQIDVTPPVDTQDPNGRNWDRSKPEHRQAHPQTNIHIKYTHPISGERIVEMNNTQY